MPRPKITVSCLHCGALERPLRYSLPFCSSRCRQLAARRGIYVAHDLERFTVQTQREGDCLIWKGSINDRGYGIFYVGRYGVYAHSFAWIVKHGPVPDGLEVCHSCPSGDNPACVEEQHLSPETHAVNMKQSAERGRTARGERSGRRIHADRFPKGTDVHTAKLTEAQVLEIRARYRPGKRGHGCRALAEQYGVSHEAIRTLVNGKTWTHVKAPSLA